MGVLLAWGDARAEPVDIELVAKAFVGQSVPAIVIVVNESLERVQIDLVRGDGHPLRRAVGPVAAPGRHRQAALRRRRRRILARSGR